LDNFSFENLGTLDVEIFGLVKMSGTGLGIVAGFFLVLVPVDKVD